MFTIIYGRREYAKKHLGQAVHPNASLDLENFYPAMMHKATRATETIARRNGRVADALKQQNEKQWFLEVQKVARKVCLNSYYIIFDEHGVLAFYEKVEKN